MVRDISQEGWTAAVRWAYRSMQRTCAPLRSAFRERFQSRSEYPLHVCVTDLARRPRTWFVQQSIQTSLQETRPRHFPTVCCLTPTSSATRVLVLPSAQARIILAATPELGRSFDGPPVLQRATLIIGDRQRRCGTANSYLNSPLYMMRCAEIP